MQTSLQTGSRQAQVVGRSNASPGLTRPWRGCACIPDAPNSELQGRGGRGRGLLPDAWVRTCAWAPRAHCGDRGCDWASVCAVSLGGGPSGRRSGGLRMSQSGHVVRHSTISPSCRASRGPGVRPAPAAAAQSLYRCLPRQPSCPARTQSASRCPVRERGGGKEEEVAAAGHFHEEGHSRPADGPQRGTAAPVSCGRAWHPCPDAPGRDEGDLTGDRASRARATSAGRNWRHSFARGTSTQGLQRAVRQAVLRRVAGRYR